MPHNAAALADMRQRVYDEVVLWHYGLYLHTIASPTLVPFAVRFPLQREQVTTPEILLQMFKEMAARARLDWPLRDLFMGAIREYLAQRLQLATPGVTLDAEWQQRLTHLRERGYTALPSLLPETVTTLREHLAQQSVYAADSQSVMPLDPVRHPGNLAIFPASALFSLPQVWEIANDPRVLSVVQQYLGVLPTMNVLTSWWSFAGRPAPKDAQLFHLDVDDVRFCKLFVYLTDVDSDGGPHVYVPGTHRIDLIAQCRDRWGGTPQEFDQWYFESFRRTDDDVARFIGTAPVELTGPAGSCFLVDTFGIHKGKLPTARDRLLFQIQYGATPNPQMALETLPVDHSTLAGAPDFLRTPPYTYVNRLFLDTQQVAPIQYQFWQ